ARPEDSADTSGASASGTSERSRTWFTFAESDTRGRYIESPCTDFSRPAAYASRAAAMVGSASAARWYASTRSIALAEEARPTIAAAATTRLRTAASRPTGFAVATSGAAEGSAPGRFAPYQS